MAAPNILCDCTGMTNEMWLKCREHGPKGNIEYTVGGSDVATIFGLSPWTTPLELWMVKKGRMKPKSPPNPDQLAMGHMLEPIAAHFYAQRTGNTVTDDNYLYQHATLEYALANIDRRYTRKEDGEGGVLECKSLTYHKAADWADGAIPIYYELQLRDMEALTSGTGSDGTDGIPASFAKEFLWNRDFALRWDLTKNLQMNFTSATHAEIEEPYGVVNKELYPDEYTQWKDSVKRSLLSLGTPIDGKGEIAAKEYRPIETPAPSIIDRQSVNRPIETGILAIDSMFPIGRGQRELIIGDRQTGKTAIALDTILNQKGKDVICIYVAIGQKASSVAQVVQTLEKFGALDYSVVVSASASDSATLQYIAPYAGCALGEYFMDKGRDVLIVYDDLSKHAIAYRALSLLLERSPGREAYPGDVFYLHSRLLERSAHLSQERGGGSMTALPIVETQAGDVSAYIPTNIISITDGQIFLESDLFFAGQRPAVNVGLSVSRVGGDAQTKAMKKAAGSLRLDLAQFREMEVFTQFSSDLDDLTRSQLTYGQGLMRLLRQPQYHPMSQHQQVILLVAALSHACQDIPVRQMDQFRKEFLDHMEKNAGALCHGIDRTGQLTDQDIASIQDLARAFVKQYQSTGSAAEE